MPRIRTVTRHGRRATAVTDEQFGRDFAAALAASSVEKAIRATAERHQPEGGYGETAWNADTRTVFWIPADWTTNDEVDAARADFLAIDGVDHFDDEAEAALPDGDGWVRVYSRWRSGVAAALTAAGVPTKGVQVQPGFDLGSSSPLFEAYYRHALGRGLLETREAQWPCEAVLEDAGEVLYRDEHGGVFLIHGSVVLARIAHGWFQTSVSSDDRATASGIVDTFAGHYPALYLQDAEQSTVPITFWTYGRYGPQSRLRRLDASPWAEIERNYTGTVRAELARLFDPSFVPGAAGQLLLWHGPPGTGKTWALRALASEWASWAECSYITDPDAFFVDAPDYMIDVLLNDSYEALDVAGDLYTEQDAGGKWRVLFLEDTGELLSADAKAKSGQGLSRLLNVVDGMIGQGLRVLVVLTTNDKIEEFHPAVARPGRCASQLLFDAFTEDEAAAWLGVPAAAAGTLAELYARVGEGDEPVPAVSEEEALSDALAAAREPLTVPAAVPPPPAPVAEVEPLTASGAPLPAALAHAAVESHRATMAALTALAAPPPAHVAEGERLAARALDVAEAFARRPEPAPALPPNVHVTLPPQNLAVTVDSPAFEPRIDVHVPEQPAPVVNVAAGEAPHVDVHVAAAEPTPAPAVTVNVPPAEVTVNVPAPAGAAARVVHVLENDDGSRSYLSEEVDPSLEPVE